MGIAFWAAVAPTSAVSAHCSSVEGHVDTHWSAKLEYQYYNFGSGTFLSGPADIVGTRFTDDEHTLKAGLNYRFNWGAPVVARY